MADIGCCKAMEILNYLFDDRIIATRGEEVLAGLQAGEPIGPLLTNLGKDFKMFSRKDGPALVQRVVDHWRADHLVMVRQTVIWALLQRQNGVPVHIYWKGDDAAPETITSIQMKDNDVFIEFAHPPVFLEMPPEEDEVLPEPAAV